MVEDQLDMQIVEGEAATFVQDAVTCIEEGAMTGEEAVFALMAAANAMRLYVDASGRMQ